MDALENHEAWMSRFYGAPVEERDAIAADELDEVVAQIRAGEMVKVTLRWREGVSNAPGTLYMDFVRRWPSSDID